MKEAVDDIMVTLNEAASEGGMVGGMVESIAESMGRVSKSVSVRALLENVCTYVQYNLMRSPLR